MAILIEKHLYSCCLIPVNPLTKAFNPYKSWGHFFFWLTGKWKLSVRFHFLNKTVLFSLIYEIFRFPKWWKMAFSELTGKGKFSVRFLSWKYEIFRMVKNGIFLIMFPCQKPRSISGKTRAQSNTFVLLNELIHNFILP